MTDIAMARALLALWNDVTPAREDEYNDWHAYEHVPERLTMPGFVWAQRWRAVEPEGPGPRYLTLYGLTSLDALETPEYKHLLANPTPWSQRMRPHLLHLSRWTCTLHAGARAASGAQMDAVCTPARPGATRSAYLLAERQRNTTPLPWLAGTQAQDVPGDWLVCADTLGERPGALYRRRFERLPVGRDSSVGISRWPAVVQEAIATASKDLPPPPGRTVV